MESNKKNRPQKIDCQYKGEIKMSELDDDIRGKHDLRTTEGKQLANEEQVWRDSPSKKNKWLALLLIWFCLHYFYVGRFGRGFIFLFTIGGLGLWAIIDIFVILFGNLKDSDGRYLK